MQLVVKAELYFHCPRELNIRSCSSLSWYCFSLHLNDVLKRVREGRKERDDCINQLTDENKVPLHVQHDKTSKSIDK